jgi:hypothetical protein
MTEPFQGGCLCGSVRFRVSPPTRFVAHCHCAYCRSAQGAAFVTWVGVPDAQFAWASGEDRVTWYASSTPSRRGFCSTCGTTLFFRSDAAPGETHVVLTAFDGPIDKAPSAHVFYDQHVDWVTLADDLPRATGSATSLGKYADIPPLKDRTERR